MSPEFENKLKTEWKHGTKGEISDFKAKIVQMAVQLFYDQKLENLTTAEGNLLLEFAEKYKIESLKVCNKN